jgi:hypothetical protein
VDADHPGNLAAPVGSYQTGSCGPVHGSRLRACGPWPACLNPADACWQSSTALQAVTVDIVFPWQRFIRVRVLHFTFENGILNIDVRLPQSLSVTSCPVFAAHFANRTRCLIGMETWDGSQHWGELSDRDGA